jgi:hypothetical protein
MEKETAKNVKAHLQKMTSGYLHFIRSDEIEKLISNKLQSLVVPEKKREAVTGQIYARLFFLQSLEDVLAHLQDNVGISDQKAEKIGRFIEQDLFNKIDANVQNIFSGDSPKTATPPPPPAPTPPGETPQTGYGGQSDPYREPAE